MTFHKITILKMYVFKIEACMIDYIIGSVTFGLVEIA